MERPRGLRTDGNAASRSRAAQFDPERRPTSAIGQPGRRGRGRHDRTRTASAGPDRVSVEPGFPAAEAKTPGREPMDGPGQDPVFFREHARGQGLGGVVRPHRDPGPLDERPRVERLGHEVDGAAVFAHPRFESSLVGPEPRERGQQGGVDVDEPSREPLREGGPEDAHESGEHDEVRPPGSVHPRGERVVELGARAKGAVVEGAGGMPAVRARSRAGARGTLLTTSAIGQPVSMSAWRLVPLPETRTTIRGPVGHFQPVADARGAGGGGSGGGPFPSSAGFNR